MSDEINREDVRPELSQLCNELADLDSGDIKGLVVQLCDRRFTGADSVHWKELPQESMQFWLDTDTTASWSKLVIALTSPSLEKFTLAENIRKKYCPWLSTVRSGGLNTLGNTRGTTISGDEERRLSLQSRSSIETNASSISGVYSRSSVDTRASSLSFDTESPLSPQNRSSFSSSVEETQSGEHTSKFCFCDNCTFQQFLYGKVCPKLNTNLELPYLDTKGMSRLEKEILKRSLHEESRDIRVVFPKLVKATIDSLIMSGVEPKVLSDFIFDHIEYEPRVKKHKSSLPDYLEQLEKADSVRTILRVIKPHYSFFNYEIIRLIIKKSDLLTNDGAEKELEIYDKKFHDYCKHRVYECPPVYSERLQSHATIHLKWDKSIYDDFTVDGVLDFMFRLIRLLDVNPSNFDIISVDIGCVQILYQLPRYLVSRVFPLTLRQEILLHDELEVTEFYCWDYKYTAKAFTMRLKLNGLAKDLTAVETRLSKHLAEKEQGNKTFFRQFRMAVLSTELTNKQKDLRLLTGHWREIIDSKTTTSILTTLRPFWDVNNPFLLDSIVQRFGNDGVKRDMKNCKARLNELKSDAMLLDYQIAQAARNKTSLPKKFTQTLELQLLQPPAEMALKQSQYYHETLLESTSFHHSALRFIPTKPSHDRSTILIWYIPTNATDIIKEYVDELIFYDNDIVIESMTLNNIPIREYRDYQKGLKLIRACRENDIEAMTKSLASGVDPNSRNEEQGTPLTVACSEGYVDVVMALLNANADVNLKENDLAPLNLASYNGHIDVVQVLLDHKDCIVDIFDEDEHTPLHRACYNGYTNVVQLLIKYGANYRRTCSDGSTALHQAANDGKHDTVNFLLSECKFPVDLTDNKNGTALHWVSYHGHVEVMKLLIETKKDLLNAQDNAGLTPLMIAANTGELAAVKLLVKYSPKINAQNKEGLTALMMASQQEHDKIVETLVDAEADVNICESSLGWSAVFFAASEGYLNITRLLVNAGADVALRDKNNTTALQLAVVHGKTSLYPLLTPAKLQKPIHQSSALKVKVVQSHEMAKEIFKRLDNWLKSTVKKKEFYRQQSQKSMEDSSSQTLRALIV